MRTRHARTACAAHTSAKRGGKQAGAHLAGEGRAEPQSVHYVAHIQLGCVRVQLQAAE